MTQSFVAGLASGKAVADNSPSEHRTKDRAAMAQQVIAKATELQTKLKTAA